ARASRPHFRWRHGGGGLVVDSVHEVHLVPDLHLPTECPGLHRTADRGLLPAWPVLPPAERRRRNCIADYRTRTWSTAPHSRAHEQSVGRWSRSRHAVALDRHHKLSPLRGIAVRDLHFRALHRELDDSAASPGENRGPHVWQAGRRRTGGGSE